MTIKEWAERLRKVPKSGEKEKKDKGLRKWWEQGSR